MMNELLEIKNLVKYYGNILAVNDISFSLKKGEIVGLLGPNGCGKSTTMKAICGAIKGYNGDVLFYGNPLGIQSKSCISYLPEKTYLSDWMKPKYIIEYLSDFFTDFDCEKAKEMLQKFNISLNMPLKRMSKGMREKTELIMTISRKAELYVLDEPLSGIDPVSRESLLDIIFNHYTKESSILLSTHQINDIERIMGRIIMMGQGKILVDDTVKNIESQGETVSSLFREVFAYV